jgi:hypothetical protein
MNKQVSFTLHEIALPALDLVLVGLLSVYFRKFVL